MVTFNRIVAVVVEGEVGAGLAISVSFSLAFMLLFTVV
jgi:hypothetical protein